MRTSYYAALFIGVIYQLTWLGYAGIQLRLIPFNRLLPKILFNVFFISMNEHGDST